MEFIHRPVLYQEVLQGLQPRVGGCYVDCTVGNGGHSEGLLAAAGPDGRLLGLDVDQAALAVARQRLAPFGDRAILVKANFRDLRQVAQAHGFDSVHGILFDLGLSSPQLADAERGFSFQEEGPLDMRFDPDQERTAAHLVNRLSVSELADLLRRYGEERRARRIAQAIVHHRPLQTTTELANLVARVVGPRGRIHPATRTFQALRIAVNDELNALTLALPQALELLAPGGRLAIISFHSLEDRPVKTFLQQETRDCLCPPGVPVCVCQHRARLRLLTRKPIRPAAEEVAANPRSRSARLRLAERLP